MTLNFIRNQRFPDQSTSTTNLAILKLPFPALRQQTYKLFWSASLHFSCADIANMSEFHGKITHVYAIIYVHLWFLLSLFPNIHKRLGERIVRSLATSESSTTPRVHLFLL